MGQKALRKASPRTVLAQRENLFSGAQLHTVNIFTESIARKK
jgi:hypothetical protein